MQDFDLTTDVVEALREGQAVIMETLNGLDQDLWAY
jgi:hypothetical protein